MSPNNMEKGNPLFWEMWAAVWCFWCCTLAAIDTHCFVGYILRLLSTTLYIKGSLCLVVCLAYGGCLLLFGLLSHTFKKHHYSLLLILTVSEFLYISFHSGPIPLSLTSYLILSPFSPSFSSPFSPSPACPPAFPLWCHNSIYPSSLSLFSLLGDTFLIWTHFTLIKTLGGTAYPL